MTGQSWFFEDAPWRALAACKGKPTRWWFDGTIEERDRAQSICARCPVREPCHEFGRREPEGRWGGVVVELERRRSRYRKSA